MGWLNSVRNAITRNLGLKLLALLLAVVAQVMVHRDGTKEEDFTARLRLLGVPRGDIFVGNVPEFARLHLRGRRVALADLKSQTNLEISVDLSAYRNGDRLVMELRQIEQQLPVRTLEVAAIEPSAFDVRMEKLQVRTLPVEIALSGEAGPGFRATPKLATSDPPVVQVAGPASLVNRLASIKTTPIDLAWAEKDLTAVVKLVLPAERLLSVKPDEVKVTVRLEEIDMTRTLVGVPVLIKGCPVDAHCSVDPPEIAVRVEGPGTAVRKLVAKPPEGLVFAEFASVSAAEKHERIQTAPVRGVAITAMPAIAKFTVVRKAADAPKP
ncbi:MAG: hypothetical protein EXR77_11750 [Myxococcales bacterium]|nr:hypothetical protein [Myxococcales bacterium]